MESFDDVDEKLDAFHLLFDPILEQHAPIRRVKLRTRPNPFVTDEIKSLMKTRDNWRKQASRTNHPDAWASFRNLKREVKQRLKKDERDYYESRVGTSDFRLRTSDFRLRTSDFRLQTSDFRLRTSDFRLQTSDFRLQTSDFGLQTSDFGLQTSDFRVQTSDFRLQTSDFRLRTSDF